MPARRGGASGRLEPAGVGAGLVLASATFWLVNLLPLPTSCPGMAGPVPRQPPHLRLGILHPAAPAREPGFRRGRRYRQPPRASGLASPAPALAEILIAVGLRLAENGGIYIFTAFAITYGKFVGADPGLLPARLTLGTAVDSAP